MNWYRASLAVGCCLVSACATPPAEAQAPASEKRVAELVEISEIHRTFADGIVAGYRISAAADRKPETEIDCFVAKITPELVLPALVSAYSTEFTHEELDLAIAFLRSPTGGKYVRYQRIKSRQALGLPTPEKLPRFSPRELELIEAFGETHIGKLIVTPDSAVSAAAGTTLRPRLVAVRKECNGNN